MQTRRAKSISIDELVKITEEAVSSAQADSKALRALEFKVGIIPDPTIVGLIIDPVHLNELRAADLQELASAISKNVQRADIAADPVTLIHDGGATMGFFPVPLERPM